MGTIRRFLRASAPLPVVALLACGCGLFGGGQEATESTSTSTTVADEPASPAPDGLHFSDVSAEAGLSAVQSPDVLVTGERMSSGLAVADVNGDGFADIFMTRAGRPNVLYVNQGDGTFRDVTSDAGLAEATPTYGSSAAAFFDTEGDGDLDLFVTGFGRGRSHLYINDGEGRFTDRALERGIVFPPLPPEVDYSQMHGVTVGDANADGSLDLLVLQWYVEGLAADVSAVMEAAQAEQGEMPSTRGACELAAMAASAPPRPGARPAGEPPEAMVGSRSKLFINNGDGTFVDRTAEMGLDFDEVLAFSGVFQDYDGDGFQDLAVTGDGCTSRLYRNVNGERFQEVTEAAGLGTDENGMGQVFKDINGDGLPDWLISSIAYGEAGEECIVGGSLVGCSGNRLYVNNGDGTFTDRTSQSGLRDGGWGWGVAVEDFANSGEPQVVMTNGFSDRPLDELAEQSDSDPYALFMKRHADDATRFWLRGAEGRFVNVAREVGITDTAISHGLVPFDYDADGDLDLLIARSGEPPLLYRNDVASDSAWLSIRLVDPTNPRNAWGDGARIEVFADGDSEPSVGWITTGGSYESQKPPVFHLGFGQRDRPVHRIDVYWPGEDTPQQLHDVGLDQRLVIERP